MNKKDQNIKFILENIGAAGNDLFSLREKYPTGKWDEMEKARRIGLDKKWIKVVGGHSVIKGWNYNYVLTDDGKKLLKEYRAAGEERSLFE